MPNYYSQIQKSVAGLADHGDEAFRHDRLVRRLRSSPNGLLLPLQVHGGLLLSAMLQFRNDSSALRYHGTGSALHCTQPGVFRLLPVLCDEPIQKLELRAAELLHKKILDK